MKWTWRTRGLVFTFIRFKYTRLFFGEDMKVLVYESPEDSEEVLDARIDVTAVRMIPEIFVRVGQSSVIFGTPHLAATLSSYFESFSDAN
ncbi:hypothetical protein NPIL_196771 [Nephila pilipes]|uniref:Uncharacterized protein n=1 Tax=Nephila pilipes TaxID=299642 RepID=A0A8X6U408_NEPPI|nr:hypothetical protein NPIL_196771 [Nephila pilipes]